LLVLQELFVEKDEGALRIQHVVEQGEALYSSTAAEGREIVRQQLRWVPDYCFGSNENC